MGVQMEKFPVKIANQSFVELCVQTGSNGQKS